MGRPVWRDVLEQRPALARGTRAAASRPTGPGAAADAPALGPDRRQGGGAAALARRGSTPVYPADLTIEPDPRRPTAPPIADRAGSRATCRPSRSRTRRGWPSPSRPRPGGPGRDRRRAGRAAGAVVRGDRVLRGRAGPARPDRRGRPGRVGRPPLVRQEAAAKATGLGMVAGPSSVEAVGGRPGSRALSRRGSGRSWRRPAPIWGGVAAPGPDVAARGISRWAWTRDGGAT